MRDNYGNMMSYNVDMVFCIDATGSMTPVIDTVKNNALNFYNDVVRELREKNKYINRMRIRLIAFRDYIADGEKAMMATNFFELPEQQEMFEQALNSIHATGGGDIPEDGLEALGFAIKSDWNKEGFKKRNIIVVWTDAPAHPLGYSSSAPNYPRGMAKSFSELTAWWGDEQMQSPYLDNSSKRMILFAPDAEGWQDIYNYWNNIIYYPSRAGEGLEEYSYKEIIDAIQNSI